MLTSLALALAVWTAPADSVHYYYVHQDVVALTNLCDHVDTREGDLLCRYRLYPLTMNKELLEGVPENIENGTARELAILSGLWGYRAANGSMISMVRYGRRSHGLIESAKQLDPEDPMVLLIEGQSLLFRPGVFGGNAQKALLCFRHLQRIVSRDSESVVGSMEADLWTWLALSRLGDSSAAVLKAFIESQSPPPLYLDFLQNPPG